MSLSHCNKCFCRFDACSECDVGADVQELRDQLSSITAERDALKARIEEERNLWWNSEQIDDLIRTAAEEEREECAKICDAQASEWDSDSVQTYKNYAGFCSSAIRSRSTKEK